MPWKGKAMPKYIVRPYYGYDCNSWNGFNNGYYLDEIEVIAENEEAASEQAMSDFIKKNSKIAVKDDNSLDHLGDYTKAWITSYSNGEGEITRTEYEELTENDSDLGGYCYQYIDFAADVKLQKMKAKCIKGKQSLGLIKGDVYEVDFATNDTYWVSLDGLSILFLRERFELI